MNQNANLEKVRAELRRAPKKWLVTGTAGFIGSHLLQELLTLGQSVVGIDNFSNGSRDNLNDVQNQVKSRWSNFTFFEGDICDEALCRKACEGVDVVLHHAALGSVPRSIANPLNSNRSNVTGFLTLLETAKNAGIRRFIYASSSSVYGDNTDLPKIEIRTGKPLSPYAVTKVANELYAHAFFSLYSMEIVGLRYFNVFGPRQLRNGPYAAVIPRWIHTLMDGKTAEIFGDGSMSRDFCYVKNVVQMNLLAAVTKQPEAFGRVFNTACGKSTSLNDLFRQIKMNLDRHFPDSHFPGPVYQAPRKGEISHSLANIEDAERILNYQSPYNVPEGLVETVEWYANRWKTERPKTISRAQSEKAEASDLSL